MAGRALHKAMFSGFHTRPLSKASGVHEHATNCVRSAGSGKRAVGVEALVGLGKAATVNGHANMESSSCGRACSGGS
jgi:hypothetical protein